MKAAGEGGGSWHGSEGEGVDTGERTGRVL